MKISGSKRISALFLATMILALAFSALMTPVMASPTVVDPNYALEVFATGLNGPFGMAFDKDGNLYVANEGKGGGGGTTISKITPDGQVSTYATGFNGPAGLAFDKDGNLWVSDDQHPINIWKIAPDGSITPGSTFEFGNPNAIAFDKNWNLFVADAGTGNISKISPDGTVSHFAGPFNCPQAVAFDMPGNVYTSDGGGRIYKIDPYTGSVNVFSEGVLRGTEGGLAFDDEGNLYASEAWSGGPQNVYVFTPDGEGKPFITGFDPADFNFPRGLIFDSMGRLYVTEYGRGIIWRATLLPKVSYWKFDEGDGNIAYDSVGPNDGTIYGATWTTGIDGSALSFDGDDYVDCGNDTSLMITDVISIEVWIKAGEQGYSGIVAKGDSPSEQSYLLQTRPGGFLEITYSHASDPNDYLWSTVYVGDNNWHHIVAIIDTINGVEKIYTDGQLDAEKSVAVDEPMATTVSNVTIGVSSNIFPEEYFIGIIDEVAIYNRVLTPEEILWHYESFKPPPEMNVVWLDYDTSYRYSTREDAVANDLLKGRLGGYANVHNAEDGTGLNLSDPTLNLTLAEGLEADWWSEEWWVQDTRYRWDFPDLEECQGAGGQVEIVGPVDFYPGFNVSRTINPDIISYPGGEQEFNFTFTPINETLNWVHFWIHVEGGEEVFDANITSPTTDPEKNIWLSEDQHTLWIQIGLEGPEDFHPYTFTVKIQVTLKDRVSIKFMPSVHVDARKWLEMGEAVGSSPPPKTTEIGTWTWNATGEYRWLWQEWFGRDVFLEGYWEVILPFSKMAELVSTEDGDMYVERLEEALWNLKIRVANTFGLKMTDVVVEDNLGGELELGWNLGSSSVELNQEDYLVEITQGNFSYKLKGRTNTVSFTWDVGELAAGETATLVLRISTDLNPKGIHEYATIKTFQMNSGANLKFKIGGEQHSMVTDPLYVDVYHIDVRVEASFSGKAKGSCVAAPMPGGLGEPPEVIYFGEGTISIKGKAMAVGTTMPYQPPDVDWYMASPGDIEASGRLKASWTEDGISHQLSIEFTAADSTSGMFAPYVNWFQLFGGQLAPGEPPPTEVALYYEGSYTVDGVKTTVAGNATMLFFSVVGPEGPTMALMFLYIEGSPYAIAWFKEEFTDPMTGQTYPAATSFTTKVSIAYL